MNLLPEAIIRIAPTVTDYIEIGERETQAERRSEGRSVAIVNRLIENAQRFERQMVLSDAHMQARTYCEQK